MYKLAAKHFYKTIYELAVLLIVVFCIVSFFMRADIAYSAVKNGLFLCYNSIIPALFPFFILSKLLLNSPFAFILGLPLLPYTKFLLKIKSNKACTALLLGLIGGFGTGAVCLNSLYSQKQITQKQANILLCAIINAGPAFVIACVGSLMLNSTQSGIYIYISLCVASLFCGFIASKLIKNTGELETNMSPQQFKASINKNNSFVQIVNEAVISTLYLCGFVVFFCFATEVLLPPNVNVHTKILLAIFFEVTTASEISASSNSAYAVYLCCFALSFMGISIFAQVRSLLSTQISLAPLLLSRLLHLPISILSLHVLLKFFAPFIPVYFAPSSARMSMPLDAACAVLFMCCSFFCVLHKNIGNCSF